MHVAGPVRSNDDTMSRCPGCGGPASIKSALWNYEDETAEDMVVWCGGCKTAWFDGEPLEADGKDGNPLELLVVEPDTWELVHTIHPPGRPQGARISRRHQ
jgi:hypothetical protein